MSTRAGKRSSGEKRLLRLIKRCENKGFHVEFVSNVGLKDYAGMNPRAARSFGLKEFPRRTFRIDGSMPPEKQRETLKHEAREYGLMGKGLTYAEAHRRALSEE